MTSCRGIRGICENLTTKYSGGIGNRADAAVFIRRDDPAAAPKF